MKNVPKYIQGLASVIVFMVSIYCIGCSETTDESQVESGGIVRIGLNNARGEIFPFAITDFSMRQISEYMLSPSLIYYDEQEIAQPALAESWEIDDENHSITYYLNPSIKWSNGDHLTSSDIKFSYELLSDSVNNYRLKSKTSPVKSIEIIDDLTCRFEFNRPVADPLYQTKIPILPVIWAKHRKYPAQIEEQYTSHFVGCGPFILTKINDDSMVFKRNKSNPNLVPNVEQVVVAFSQAINSDKVKQRLNIIVNVPVENVSYYQRDSLYRIMTYPERGYSFLAWNLKHKMFKNYALRKALTLGIDREAIVDGVLAGFGSVIDGPVYPEDDTKVPDLVYDYNPGLAQDMLDSLGWRENDTGVRYQAGQALKFSLKVNKENAARQKIAVNIKQNLAAIGVDVKLETVAWSDILSAITEKSFDALLVTWIDGDQYDPSELFHSAGLNSGLNLTSYSNPTADYLIEKGLNSSSPEVRAVSWQQFKDVITSDLPCTFLFNQKIIVAVSTEINDIAMDRRGYLVNIKDWWISDR